MLENTKESKSKNIASLVSNQTIFQAHIIKQLLRMKLISMHCNQLAGPSLYLADAR